MSSIIDNLKSHLRSYSKLDDEIQVLNKQVYDLRNERKEIETHIATILTNPELSQIEKIQLSEDNSVLKIQRPGWTKPWSLSKKELKSCIDSYFQSGKPMNPDDLYSYIVESQKDKLSSNDFSFTRIKND